MFSSNQTLALKAETQAEFDIFFHCFCMKRPLVWNITIVAEMRT